MVEKRFVCVELSRYEELVRCETRVDAACELAERDADIETILLALGTDKSRELANKIRQDYEEKLARYRENNNVD